MTAPLQLNDIPRGTVTVGVDGSTGSDGALDWAADTAARQHRTLAVVHTETPYVPWNASGYPSAVPDSPELRDAVLAAGLRCTGDARARALERHPDLDVIEASDVIDARLGLAATAKRAHLLVVGSRGRGPLKTLLLGSVSVSVSREPSCPVVVVRPAAPDATDGSAVLALVDGTPASTAVLEFAARHASEVGAPLRINHLLWTSFDIDNRLVDESERMLAEITAGLGEKFPDVAMTMQVDDIADPERLVATTADVALVVVGHRPAGRLHHLLYRSVSTTILEHAHVPVAVVPTPAD